MRDMQVLIGKDSFELIDAHFSFPGRIIRALELIFTGYFSFKSGKKNKIIHEDTQAHKSVIGGKNG